MLEMHILFFGGLGLSCIHPYMCIVWHMGLGVLTGNYYWGEVAISS